MKRLALYILAALALVSCQELNIQDESQDGAKTPVVAVTTLDGASAADVTPLTRAKNYSFEKNDAVKVFFQHVTTAGNPEVISTIDGSTYNQLVDLKVSNVGTTSTSPQYIATLTREAGLFWEDFSDVTNDIRTDGHKLRVKYAYCYNGGTPSSALDNNAGTLGWTVQSNQTAANFKKSDLLFATTQDPVKYDHGTSAGYNTDGGKSHGEIRIPFRHAMAKMTIYVHARDGFVQGSNGYLFRNDEVTINNGGNKLYTQCMVDAIAQTVTSPSAPVAISAPASSVTNYTDGRGNRGTFQYVFVPGTEIAAKDALFATLMINGNTYEVPVTEDMLSTASGKWGSKLTDGKFQGGVNYVLTITVDKARVYVTATIKDWEDVEAEPVEGKIVFTADVTENRNVEGSAITADGASFDLYQLPGSNTSMKNSDYGAKTTTSTYSSTDSKWVNSPEIYWPNGTDEFYFRALANYDADKKVLSQGTENVSLQQGDGTDVMWGTTSYHQGYDENGHVADYSEGFAINPRTGKVPMVFYHAMSKISVDLKTSEDATAAVDLQGAKIYIKNIATQGTINLHDGSTTPGDIVEAAINDMYARNDSSVSTPKLSEYKVVPQSIADNALLVVVLADDTRYKLQLNTCKVKDATTLIKTWERGKHYVYEIELSKEVIRLRAVIKEWVEVEAEGTAELEWD